MRDKLACRTMGASMVGRAGPLATISGEPRQARKGAAATTDSGAGMWLVRSATSNLKVGCFFLKIRGLLLATYLPKNNEPL